MSQKPKLTRREATELPAELEEFAWAHDMAVRAITSLDLDGLTPEERSASVLRFLRLQGLVIGLVHVLTETSCDDASAAVTAGFEASHRWETQG